MSRIARRVAHASLAVLGVQFAVALGIQVALSLTLRRGVVQEITQGLESAGALERCVQRPGPWGADEGWLVIWPLTEEGTIVGEGAPARRVALPEPRAIRPWSLEGYRGVVYASPSTECGGALIVLRHRYPLLEAQSSRVAMLAALRLLVVILAAIALVSVTAVPLVRRIQALSLSMRRVVARDFEGTVADGTDDELGEVARAFDAATASTRDRLSRLEHRDAVLRRALADLAHDLRTPLATLQLSASSLPVSNAATTIRSELGFLESMTQNFEALLGGDDGELSPVALDRLIERVQHRFAPIARDRQLAFEVALPDEALYAEADSVALERALGNLVQNALRFAVGHVGLLLFRDDDEVRLEVRDDGPGFGELSGRAAERGVRGTEAGGQGFGLGLAIAEAAARRLGGRLELRDGDEGGALVALVLPWVDGMTRPRGDSQSYS
ncbi:MAG: HAMP domain-containing sensor histidine kinase [Myxococcota bacterium]